MSSVLALRCRCGKVRGHLRNIHPKTVNRVVCYCRYCQSYAHTLGFAEETLDPLGGSEVFQMSPADLDITEGIENIQCGRQSKKGARRWNTSCCHTPLANTLETMNAPFMGVFPLCVEELNSGDVREKRLGPVRARVNRSFSKEEHTTLGATGRIALASMLLRLSRMLLGWRIKGDHKKAAFFDGDALPTMGTYRIPLSPKIFGEKAQVMPET